jgi:hypothetical protein
VENQRYPADEGGSKRDTIHDEQGDVGERFIRLKLNRADHCSMK